MHQMFVDMSMLVHANGALIDSIESNVNDARDYVKKAVVKLDDGQQSHKSAKKVGVLTLIILMMY